MPIAPTKAPSPAQAQAAPANPAAMAQGRFQSNLHYLLTTYEKSVICPPAAGAGTSQTYVAGQTLIYDVPSANGAFLDELLFECALTVNPATGTGATYALNAGAPFNLIDHIIVQFGQQQIWLRPFILRTLSFLGGYERSAPSQVNTGNAITGLTSTIWGTPFALTTATNNPWNFWFRLPLRWIKRSAAGMLPAMGGPTGVQVQVVLASAADGPDPILNAVLGANTGHNVVVGGTIKVVAKYRDGYNYGGPSPLALDLTGQPTIQLLNDLPLNPLSAGTVQAQRISNKLQHLYAISVVVDGNQSNLFAANSNIQDIELRQDFAGANRFWAYGTNGNNIGVNEYFENIRNTLGQDLDQGIIPWIPGPAFGGVNPDNQEGARILNMMVGGWTDASYAVQVGAVTATTITPRVETYLVSINPAGLVTQ